MRVLVVDSFAERAFRGNPAGVCLLERPADPGWMQALAAELRHAETAFVCPDPDGVADFWLRWFTPTVEVDLCGHATLAAAHVLFADGRESAVSFRTRSGVLVAELRPDGLVGMDFPAAGTSEVESPPRLAEAFRIASAPVTAKVAADAVPDGGRVSVVRVAAAGTGDLLVEVADAETVRRLEPDFGVLAEFDVRGVIVTAGADAGADHDFVSRFFGPRVGIPEDPVTGSAHCVLGPYWGDRLGRTELVGAQLSPRGGRVVVELRGDRATLAGRAITVLDGTLTGHSEPPSPGV